MNGIGGLQCYTWMIGYGISEEEADPRPIMGSSEVRNRFNTTTESV